MSKFKRKITALGILAIYIVTTWLFYAQELDSQKSHQHKIHADAFISVISNCLTGDALTPVKAVSSAITNGHPASKEFPDEFSLFFRFGDHLVSNLTDKYTSPVADPVPALSRAVIIFPFHYFW